MTFNQFVTKLRGLNPKIRVIPGNGRVAGIYIFLPKHPIANPQHGLKHLGGMPSPRFFSTLPKYSFWDDKLGGFNKGWASVLRELWLTRIDGLPVITKQDAFRVFGNFFSRYILPKRIEKIWAAKQRLKEKYPMMALPDARPMVGSMVVSS